MSEHSKIEWTDATWNPVRGCVKISPGCKHCYAATFAERFRNVPGHPYERGFDPRIVPHKLLEPILWPSPKRVFVNSMSDLFQEGIPEEYILAVAEVMLRTPWHTYQVLTKRADRLRELLATGLREAAGASHIWWGVSVEDRKYGLPRIDELRATPAVFKFLSVEPLLEDLGAIDLTGIDWAIVGGESGPGARPMEAAWVENIREECGRQGTQFFFKQWGGVQKARAGRLLDGRTWDDIPEQPEVTMPPRRAREALTRELGYLQKKFAASSILPEPL